MSSSPPKHNVAWPAWLLASAACRRQRNRGLRGVAIRRGPQGECGGGVDGVERPPAQGWITEPVTVRGDDRWLPRELPVQVAKLVTDTRAEASAQSPAP